MMALLWVKELWLLFTYIASSFIPIVKIKNADLVIYILVIPLVIFIGILVYMYPAMREAQTKLYETFPTVSEVSPTFLVVTSAPKSSEADNSSPFTGCRSEESPAPEMDLLAETNAENEIAIVQSNAESESGPVRLPLTPPLLQLCNRECGTSTDPEPVFCHQGNNQTLTKCI